MVLTGQKTSNTHGHGIFWVWLFFCLTIGDTQAQEVEPASARYVLSVFQPRQTALNDELVERLDAIVDQWQDHRELEIQVVGFTDDVPIAEENRQEFADNQALASERAETVAAYLRGALSLADDRVSARGVGSRQPIATNETVSGRAKNRRVEVTVSGFPPEQPEPPSIKLEDVLKQANRLMGAGDWGQALAFLKKHEQFSGQPEYDYLYALALRANGQLEEAMFALSRVLTVDPNFAGARLELAQILLELGAKAEAKSELLVLQTQNPPPAAREAIAQALAEIDAPKATDPPPRFKYYLRSAAGFDSNANSATDLNSFLGFTLSENSRETSSSFSEVGGGFQFVGRPQGSRRFISSFDLGHRFNFDASFVNATTARFSFASRWSVNGQNRAIGVQSFRQEVDGSLNSQGASLVANWSFQPSTGLVTGFFGRAGLVRFGDEQSVRDADQLALGANFSYAFASQKRANVSGVLLLGTDSAKETDSRYNRDFYGLGLSASWLFSPRIRGRLYTNVLESDFDEVFFPEQFSDPREDRLTQIGSHFSWKLNKHWVLDHYLVYFRNETDVSVFDYDRIETQITATRLW